LFKIIQQMIAVRSSPTGVSLALIVASVCTRRSWYLSLYEIRLSEGFAIFFRALGDADRSRSTRQARIESDWQATVQGPGNRGKWAIWRGWGVQTAAFTVPSRFEKVDDGSSSQGSPDKTHFLKGLYTIGFVMMPVHHQKTSDNNALEDIELIVRARTRFTEAWIGQQQRGLGTHSL
jgi:hypothetical protein